MSKSKPAYVIACVNTQDPDYHDRTDLFFEANEKDKADKICAEMNARSNGVILYSVQPYAD